MPFKKGEGGRPKNAQNKTTKQVKEMIVQALEKAGGVDYLVAQAKKPNPAAFLALVGKVVPHQLVGEGDGPLHITITRTDEKL